VIVAKPKPDAPPPAITVQVDEVWLAQWVAYGFKEMSQSLARHAAFDQYVKTHPQPKDDAA